MSMVQALGSALTYLQRYSLRAAIGLAAAVDDDGRGAGGTSPRISADQANELQRLIEETRPQPDDAAQAHRRRERHRHDVDQFTRAKRSPRPRQGRAEGAQECSSRAVMSGAKRAADRSARRTRRASCAALKSGGFSADRDSLMADKVLERLTGVPVEIPKTSAMLQGTAREPEARVLYETGQGPRGRAGRPRARIRSSRARTPRPMASSCGGTALGLVEIKCPLPAAHLDTLLTETISNDHIVQMQWQMACTGPPGATTSVQPRLPARDAALDQARPSRRGAHRRAGERDHAVHHGAGGEGRQALTPLRGGRMSMAFNYPNHPLFRIAPLLDKGFQTVRFDPYERILVAKIRAGQYSSDLWDCNSLYLGSPWRRPAIRRPVALHDDAAGDQGLPERPGGEGGTRPALGGAASPSRREESARRRRRDEARRATARAGRRAGAVRTGICRSASEAEGRAGGARPRMGRLAKERAAILSGPWECTRCLKPSKISVEPAGLYAISCRECGRRAVADHATLRNVLNAHNAQLEPASPG